MTKAEYSTTAEDIRDPVLAARARARADDPERRRCRRCEFGLPRDPHLPFF